jgi:hypothetical protein
LSRLWWGCGIRLIGAHRDNTQLALGNSLVLRLKQGMAQTPLDVSSIVSRMDGANPMAVRAMGLGVALFGALRDDDMKKDAFRELTKSWWRMSVSDRDFIAWCVDQRVDVPPEFLS